MTRDYKRRTRSRSRRKAAPAWLWLVTGLAIGLFAAFLWQLDRDDKPATPRPAPSSRPLSETAPVVQIPQAPAATRPRYEFYTILPEMEVVVPEESLGSTTRQGVRQVEKPGTYLLQAGSFRNFEQADRLKARLALLGLETDVQTVTINDHQTWHRVRVGPFSDLKDLNRVRVQLREQGIDAILLQVKG